MKLGQNVASMKSRTRLKMGHVGSKTKFIIRSNLKKTCVGSRGHIFRPILIKLGQDACLDKISCESENGSCWVTK